MGLEGLRRYQRQTRCFGFVDHRPAQGVLRSFFHRSGQHHQFVFRHPVAGIGNQVGDHRFAFGDGAGFVQNHRGQTGGNLQCPTVFEKHAPFGALAGAGHDRGGCGQTQGTGAGDDQYGHHADHGGHKIAGDDPPDGKNQQGNHDDRRYEHSGDAIGQGLDGGLAALGLLHQADDLGQGGFPAHPGGGEDDDPLAVDGAGGHRVA